jgi:hypothetical protein
MLTPASARFMLVENQRVRRPTWTIHRTRKGPNGVLAVSHRAPRRFRPRTRLQTSDRQNPVEGRIATLPTAIPQSLSPRETTNHYPTWSLGAAPVRGAVNLLF